MASSTCLGYYSSPGNWHIATDKLPEQCLEKILRYAEAGVDQLLCYCQFGDLPHEKIMRNIELLGTKVVPELEKRGHRVDYSRLAG